MFFVSFFLHDLLLSAFAFVVIYCAAFWLLSIMSRLNLDEQSLLTVDRAVNCCVRNGKRGDLTPIDCRQSLKWTQQKLRHTDWNFPCKRLSRISCTRPVFPIGQMPQNRSTNSILCCCPRPSTEKLMLAQWHHAYIAPNHGRLPHKPLQTSPRSLISLPLGPFYKYLWPAADDRSNISVPEALTINALIYTAWPIGH